MPQVDPVRVVLIGCGAVSQIYHGPALRRLEAAGELQVVGLFDPDAGSLGAVARNFPRASRMEEVREIADLGAELAIVASPPRFHAEQSILALKSGLSVLCEKPIAPTVAEAEAMIEVAKGAKGVLAVGLFRRFFPATRTIRSVLANQAMGELTSFRWFNGCKFNWPVTSADYFDRAASKGGVLLDLGVHVFDLLLWWFGEPADIRYEDDAVGGVETNCRIYVRFDQGFEGEILLSRDWTRPNHFLFEGARGWMLWEANEAESLKFGFPGSPFHVQGLLGFGSRPTEGSNSPPVPDFHQCFVEQLRNVVAAARGEGELLVPASEALSGLRMVEHCYRTRNLMPMPWLEESEWTRAKALTSER